MYRAGRYRPDTTTTTRIRSYTPDTPPPPEQGALLAPPASSAARLVGSATNSAGRLSALALASPLVSAAAAAAAKPVAAATAAATAAAAAAAAPLLPAVTSAAAVARAFVLGFAPLVQMTTPGALVARLAATGYLLYAAWWLCYPAEAFSRRDWRPGFLPDVPPVSSAGTYLLEQALVARRPWAGDELVLTTTIPSRPNPTLTESDEIIGHPFPSYFTRQSPRSDQLEAPRPTWVSIYIYIHIIYIYIYVYLRSSYILFRLDQRAQHGHGHAALDRHNLEDGGAPTERMEIALARPRNLRGNPRK